MINKINQAILAEISEQFDSIELDECVVSAQSGTQKITLGDFSCPEKAERYADHMASKYGLKLFAVA